jgi:hypothetical protein
MLLLTVIHLFDTNVMELVLDYTLTDSLEDPSSTAIPFATTDQAVMGEWGKRHKEKTPKG